MLITLGHWLQLGINCRAFSWCWKFVSVVLDDLQQILLLFFIACQTWVELLNQGNCVLCQVVDNSDRLDKLLALLIFCLSSHWLGSTCRKSWDMPTIVKKIGCLFHHKLAKLWSIFVVGFWNGWIHFRGSSDALTSWSATTIKRFSSVVTLSSQRRNAQML